MTIACASCGARQRIPSLPPRASALCWRCDAPLERAPVLWGDAALACSLAALILLIPANLLPVLRSHLANRSLEGHLIEGAAIYWRDGWPLVAVMVGLFAVALPLLRTGLLVAVLGSLRLGLRARWQGRFFRYVEALRLWSMPEVMLLGAAVTYSRVAAQLQVDIAVGGWCFIGAAALLLVTEGVLDARGVWRRIRPERDPPPAAPTLACDLCGLVHPADREGRRCQRCARTLHARRPGALNRCAAFTVAAYVLYVPAYVFPMTRTVRPDGLTERTILDGVHELFTKGFWYLGVIIFLASVAIPLLKLLGLTWLLLRVKYPATGGLRLRTKTHRVVHEINRWSFVDPFIVAMTAPMMAYADIADVHAGPGALAFSLVVALTMLASGFFDPRLMWDAAERRL